MLGKTRRMLEGWLAPRAAPAAAATEPRARRTSSDTSSARSSSDDKEPETASEPSPVPRLADGLAVGTVLGQAPLDSDDDESEDETSDDAKQLVPPEELGPWAGVLELTRGSYHNARKLARAIKSGVYVLVITGAGVSVASGIKTYRTGEDGVWNNFVYEVCRAWHLLGDLFLCPFFLRVDVLAAAVLTWKWWCPVTVGNKKEIPGKPGRVVDRLLACVARPRRLGLRKAQRRAPRSRRHHAVCHTNKCAAKQTHKSRPDCDEKQKVPERAACNTKHRPLAPAGRDRPTTAGRGARSARPLPLHKLVCHCQQSPRGSTKRQEKIKPMFQSVRAHTTRASAWKGLSLSGTSTGAWCRRGALHARVLCCR